MWHGPVRETVLGGRDPVLARSDEYYGWHRPLLHGLVPRQSGALRRGALATIARQGESPRQRFINLRIGTHFHRKLARSPWLAMVFCCPF